MEKKIVSTITLIVLIVSMALVFNIQPVEASESIYIRADGSVDPPTVAIQRDGDVYTLTGNIYDGIVVERDNIVVDGAGYKVYGAAGGYGIYLPYRSNVTLKNLRVLEFNRGIGLIYSNHNVLSGIESSGNYDVGIYLFQSINNNLSGNIVRFNYGPGIYLDSSNDNVLSGNTAWSNYYGIIIWDSEKNVVSGNTIAYNTWGVTVSCSNNAFFHNNFFKNWIQVQGYGNTWDNGYPSGGNYWYWEPFPPWEPPYYCRSDKFSGPNQDVPGADGIIDEPYTIDAQITDNYPLVKPYVAHDIGITAISPSETTVDPGSMLDINIRVVNYGSNTETFNLTIYANTAVIYQTEVTLSIRDFTTITFSWDTTGVTPNTYTVKAQASVVPGETDTADNTFIDGQVTVSIHDIAITEVKPSETLVPQSCLVFIFVTVKNEGNVPETFNVTAYYDDTPFQSRTISLNAGASTTLMLDWWPWDVGTHTIKAQADVLSGETDTADNTFIDGQVTVERFDVHLTQELVEIIKTYNLPAGTENSLTSKLEEAILLLDKGNEDGAIHKLTDFTNQVEALREKNLTNEQADSLIDVTQMIIYVIRTWPP